MYILCELNDENYTQPSFSFHESFDSAQITAIESIIEDFKCSYGFDFQLTTEDTEIKSEYKGNRISGEWKVFGLVDEEHFYVTEMLAFDASKGTHLLIWHHAYEGVGFTIEKQGTYEECFAEKKRQMSKIIEEANINGGDNRDFDIETDAVIDTGNEWEMWSIVEVKKIEKKEGSLI